MKVIFVFPLVFAAVASFPRRNVLPVREALGLSPRIISGQDAILGQFPWQVLNRYVVPAGRGLCGGALVDPRWVLTAAHCADGISEFEITLGSLYSDGRDEPQATTIKASFAYVHIDFNSLSLENDVAVIDLVQGVALTNFIQTIPLGFDEIGSGVRLVASGWGKTSDSGSVSSILKYVGLDTISNDECAIIYGSITDGSLCCRGAPEHSTCSGDSGGPLVEFDENGVASHAGVSSFVHTSGCATGNPSGFARTSFYRDWVVNIIINDKK